MRGLVSRAGRNETAGLKLLCQGRSAGLGRAYNATPGSAARFPRNSQARGGGGQNGPCFVYIASSSSLAFDRFLRAPLLFLSLGTHECKLRDSCVPYFRRNMCTIHEAARLAVIGGLRLSGLCYHKGPSVRGTYQDTLADVGGTNFSFACYLMVLKCYSYLPCPHYLVGNCFWMAGDSLVPAYLEDYG